MPESDELILTEMNVESRTIVARRAPTAAIQALLPAGWTSAPFEAGPPAGANVIIIFSDRQFVASFAGAEVVGQSVNQIGVVAIPASGPQAEQRGVVIAFGFSASDDGTPGPYGVFKKSDATVTRILRSQPDSLRTAIEDWRFTTADDEVLALHLEYTRGIPVRSDAETHAYSAAKPSFYRIYRADQGVDAVYSGAGDHTINVNLEARGARLESLIDGSTQLVAILSEPWIVRRVFVPKDQ